MPQELFNAVCCQKKLKKLDIKWGSYPDISAISNLKSLEFLHLGSGRSVESIEPLSKLENLLGLSVENLQNIHDYSSFAKLKKLESLSIQGDGFAPKNIHIDSIEFLRKMPNLRYLNFGTFILKNKDYTPILSLENLEHLSISPKKELKAIYKDLMKLSKLKYGYIIKFLSDS